MSGFSQLGVMRLTRVRTLNNVLLGYTTNWDVELHNDELKMLLDVRVLWGRRSPTRPVPSSHLPRAVHNLRSKSQRHQQAGNLSPLSRSETHTSTNRYIRVFNSSAQWQRVTTLRRRPSGSASNPVPFVNRPVNKPAIRSRRSRSKELS